MKKILKKTLNIFMAIGDAISGFGYSEVECDWCGIMEQGYMMESGNCVDCATAKDMGNTKVLLARKGKFRKE